MPFPKGRLSALLLLSTQLGCDIFDTGCDAYASQLLTLSIRDSQSKQLIPIGFGLTVCSAKPGDCLILDVAPPTNSNPFTIPENARPGWAGGTYSIEIRAQGYQVWQKQGVTIGEESHCHHPIGESVIADLVHL